MALLSFPVLPGLTYGNKCTLVWSSLRQTATSGRETRIGLWSYPQRRWELTYEFLRNSPATPEWQTLMGFYNRVGGSAGTFLYSDPNDNTVSGQVFGTGDGVTTTFQLIRTVGGFPEPVFVLNGPPAILINGVPTFAVVVPGLDTNLYGGNLTFVTPPPAGVVLSWNGAFSWLCRFDEDTLETAQVMSPFWEAKTVKFSSVKL